MLEEREDALWTRAMIDVAASGRCPELRRIVVAVDPPVSATKRSDACGIVVAGVAADGNVWVLEDATVQGKKPHEWAGRVANAYHRHEADRVIAETNQGGNMVESVIRTVDPAIPVRPVRARRGKWLRAEPVAALYEQGRVRHARRFPLLEDEMCDFGPDGLSSGRSPDRLDALVWAVTELALGREGTPRIRGIT
jgi:phage terminase large subunit-like protein